MHACLVQCEASFGVALASHTNIVAGPPEQIQKCYGPNKNYRILIRWDSLGQSRYVFSASTNRLQLVE